MPARKHLQAHSGLLQEPALISPAPTKWLSEPSTVEAATGGCSAGRAGMAWLHSFGSCQPGRRTRIAARAATGAVGPARASVDAVIGTNDWDKGGMKAPPTAISQSRLCSGGHEAHHSQTEHLTCQKRYGAPVGIGFRAPSNFRRCMFACRHPQKNRQPPVYFPPRLASPICNIHLTQFPLIAARTGSPAGSK